MEKHPAVIDRIEGSLAVCVRDSDGQVFEVSVQESFSENERVILCISEDGITIEKAKEKEEIKESNKARLRRLFDRKNEGRSKK